MYVSCVCVCVCLKEILEVIHNMYMYMFPLFLSNIIFGGQDRVVGKFNMCVYTAGFPGAQGTSHQTR